LKMLYGLSWSKMFGCARLAVLQQFENRANFISDAFIQPTIIGLVELTLWLANRLELSIRAQLKNYCAEGIRHSRI
jgi:hypothetical protein